MRCKTCDYWLKNLTEHRCPECGREFDPNNSDSWATHHPFPFWPITGRVAALGVLMFMTVLGMSLLSVKPGQSWKAVFIAAVATSVAVIAISLLLAGIWFGRHRRLW